MEDNSRLENLENILASIKGVKAYSAANFATLDILMQQYWLILKELSILAPTIFNNLATNGIIDLINRSNLTEQAVDPKEKSSHYKDYWDYLTHSVQITIDYIKNYLPESLAFADAE
jgi:hypothetical protein